MKEVKIEAIEYTISSYYEIDSKDKTIEQALEDIKKNPKCYLKGFESTLTIEDVEINLNILCPSCNSKITHPINIIVLTCPSCNTQIIFCPKRYGGCDVCDKRVNCLADGSSLSTPYPRIK